MRKHVLKAFAAILSVAVILTPFSSLPTASAVGETFTIDNGESGFMKTGLGWGYDGSNGYLGDHLEYEPGIFPFRAEAKWMFLFIEPGEYEVFVTWVSSPEYATVEYTVEQQTESIDQANEPSGVTADGRPWQSLGMFDVDSSIRVTLTGDPTTTFSADAVRIVRTGDLEEEEEEEQEEEEEEEEEQEEEEEEETSEIEFRTINGYGNNETHPELGMAKTQLSRKMEAEYDDGFASGKEAGMPSARAVSNAVSAQEGSMPNDSRLTDYVWQWGQFLDHDLDLTEGTEPMEMFNIPVPTGDPFFDPTAAGDKVIMLNRSKYDHATGHPGTPRQQMNDITAFIDASNVYGSDDTRADALRTHTGGKLKVSDGNLLPFNTAGLPNAGGEGAELFLAGDVRANEQTGLTAMHTLFVREHNRLADELAVEHPDWDDEMLYQHARRIVGAQMQVITYEEFLPALLGRKLFIYTGYKSDVDAGIHNVFSTAGYRFGHSMLSSTLLRTDEAGNEISDGHLALRDAFFNPSRIIDEGGIDPVLRGLASQHMQEIDTKLVDDVRNFLFGPPGSGGFDLAALNIQRGRDHGLPGYNKVRDAYGLRKARRFRDITRDEDVAQALEDTYGDVNLIDAWVGILAEDHVPGTSVGPLMRKILIDQFTRLRDGDRFYYESYFTSDEVRELKRTRLSDIIRRNTDINNIQDDVFKL